MLKSLKQLYWDFRFGGKHFYSLRNERAERVLEILGIQWRWNRGLSRFDEILQFRRFDDDISLDDQKYYLDCQLNKNTGYTVNWDNPQTFNEKIHWLKLFYKNPKIQLCADKYRAYDYVEPRVGALCKQVERIGVYDSPEDIDFSSLPNQFVLKVNWGSSQNIICTDKERLDIEKAKQQLYFWMRPQMNQYFSSFEWGYKDIIPKIICEKYIQELEKSPYIYKIMCFNGKPGIIQFVIDDKKENETINYYDTNWNLLPFRQNFPNNPNHFEKPQNLEKLLEIAEILSKDFPFVRVDLFDINSVVLFSEMTFYSDAGIAKFTPSEWDIKLGQMIQLPEKWQ